MNYIPQENKLILGVSSLWLSQLISDSYMNELYLFMFLLSNIIIASPLYWYNHIIYSYAYFYDLSFVYIYTILLFFYILFIKVILVLVFYSLSDYYLKKQLSHIIFRYVFFIWSYLYINKKINNQYLLYVSTNYFLYNYYLYKTIKKYNINLYISHCIQILFINFSFNYISN
jgi:hypothetical protein